MVLSGGYGRYVTTGYKTNLRKKKTDYLQFGSLRYKLAVRGCKIAWNLI